ncbi:serine hydrolase domain-containing protein [Paremcibacter congregatus]|uniref:serine hydrolase domain-containing protein n=1 Tax=Paremcibacter congregatus TaxID=2043170 RepID=UPI003A90977E
MTNTGLDKPLSIGSSDDLQAYAERVIESSGVPAVSLAAWKDGRLYEGAVGCLNLDTGVEATTDSIFQIGSITKVFTACLLMKLVEDGRLDLDTPVVQALRDFSIADQAAAKEITVRQLLNHTSGIAGDYFTDDNHDDGPHIARFIDRCSQLPLVHPVGASFSYSNVAFAVAGRMVEKCLGISWFDAMEELIFTPLGMDHAICRPAEVIKYRTAIGHIADYESPGSWKTSSGKYTCFGQSPAGTTPTMKAKDLITFARAHMSGGLTEEGKRWLTSETITQMHQPTVRFPATQMAMDNAMGLGWFLQTDPKSGRRFYQHGGATNGQLAMLRIFPDTDSCFALLMNAQCPMTYNRMIIDLTQAVGGMEPQLFSDRPEISMSPEELAPFEGCFTAYAGDYHFAVKENRLTYHYEDSVDEDSTRTGFLKPIGHMCFLPCDEDGAVAPGTSAFRFITSINKNRPKQLFAALRLFTREEN